MPENILMGQLHLSKACWELWLSDDQPHSDYNGQWQRALAVHTGSPAKFPTKPTEEWKKNRKMYAIKQIKICAEYRDMLPRPRLDLSGTPGLRPIGLSPGSWQTSLGLGSMSRYSAQILICIIYYAYMNIYELNTVFILYIRSDKTETLISSFVSVYWIILWFCHAKHVRLNTIDNMKFHLLSVNREEVFVNSQPVLDVYSYRFMNLLSHLMAVFYVTLIPICIYTGIYTRTVFYCYSLPLLCFVLV